MANPLPPPSSEAISQARKSGIAPGARDEDEGMVSDTWLRWFTSQAQLLGNAAKLVVSPISLTGQQASIGTTSIAPSQSAAGLYRITYYTRVIQAATTSSSLTVTLGWVDHTVTLSSAGAALTGNTVTTFETRQVMVYIDALTSITYATTYASVGGTPMQYSLFLTLETVSI